MYGYHVGWKFYLKIYMLNPAYMHRLADLLRNGSIMGRPLQPYEVHIPYLLQFMADYGLYGCGWVECQIVTFRAPVPAEQNSFGGLPSAWDESCIPRHLIATSKDKPRQSHCAIEIDLLSHHIRNRRTIEPRVLHYDFVERSNPVPLEEKLVHSMAELWKDEERRRALRGENQPPPSLYTSVPRHNIEDGGEGPWIHEKEMRAKLEELIRGERARSDGHALQFESFVKQTKFQSLVQTALESVTDMFPPESPSSSQKKENYVGLKPSSGHLREDSGAFPSAHVDEARILALLDDIETSAGDVWKDTATAEDYVSETSDESLSEVDFDDDLLGRGQDELRGVLFQRGTTYQRPRLPVTTHDNLQFSDDLDLDLDFDVGRPTSVKFQTTLQRPSVTEGDRETHSSTTRQTPANDAEPLRLRGGASTPELKVRKRERNPSTVSPVPKRMRFLEPIIHTSSNQTAVGNSSTDLFPNSGSVTNVSGISASYSMVPLHSEHEVEVVKSRHGLGSVNASCHTPTRPRKSASEPREFAWSKTPPSTAAIISTLRSLHVPRVLPRAAYYSQDEDVPVGSREYGGREYRLVSESLPYLGTFDCGFPLAGSIFRSTFRALLVSGPSLKVWQFERKPPRNGILEVNADGTYVTSLYGHQPGLTLTYGLKF
jgi:DNA polymerase zeta